MFFSPLTEPKKTPKFTKSKPGKSTISMIKQLILIIFHYCQIIPNHSYAETSRCCKITFATDNNQHQSQQTCSHTNQTTAIINVRFRSNRLHTMLRAFFRVFNRHVHTAEQHQRTNHTQDDRQGNAARATLSTDYVVVVVVRRQCFRCNCENVRCRR